MCLQLRKTVVIKVIVAMSLKRRQFNEDGFHIGSIRNLRILCTAIRVGWNWRIGGVLKKVVFGAPPSRRRRDKVEIRSLANSYASARSQICLSDPKF